MAQRMTLRTPVQGMRYIWNISSPVGDNNACPNRQEDTKLVKCLVSDTICCSPNHFSFLRMSCRNRIDPNQPWDPATALYLRVFAMTVARHLNVHDAGTVSPATPAGEYRSGGRQHGFIIVLLNLQVFLRNRALFDDYPSQRVMPYLTAEAAAAR